MKHFSVQKGAELLKYTLVIKFSACDHVMKARDHVMTARDHVMMARKIRGQFS